MNGDNAGALSIGNTKFGGANVGVCGPNSWIEVCSAGPPREIVFAKHVPAVGTVAAGNEKHGTTCDWTTEGTVSTVGIITLVLLVPVVPITAPAGNEPASKKILAKANAIKSFTLISIPSLINQ
jgi:hypothetical protein